MTIRLRVGNGEPLRTYHQADIRFFIQGDQDFLDTITCLNRDGAIVAMYRPVVVRTHSGGPGVTLVPISRGLDET